MQHKDADSLIWGATGALICAVGAILTNIIPGIEPIPQSIAAAGAGGFTWGFIIAEIRNWVGRRKL